MPKLTVINQTNSPFDLEGGVRLPAMGQIVATFTAQYAAALRASPGVEVVEDGSAGLTPDEKLELLEAMTDDELRQTVEEITGAKPHHRAGRGRLIAMARGNV